MKRSGSRSCVAALAAATAVLVAAPGAVATDWLVAVGDSYSRGSQPGRANGDEGFVYQLPTLARGRGYDLQVANFACGGATSASLVSRAGCDGRKTQVSGDRTYEGESQLSAAARFIAANRADVGLVTVSVGLNDLGPCLRRTAAADCPASAATAMRANVAALARTLREASGPGVPIVGVGYPNVYLGSWLRPGGRRGHERARAMRQAFIGAVNPALRSAYAAGEARFADATRASGGYGSLDGRRLATGFGAVPGPVARICRISWFCSRADIHLNRAGYRLLARTVAGQLPRRKAAATVARDPRDR